MPKTPRSTKKSNVSRLLDLHTLISVKDAITRIPTEPGFSFNQWLNDNIAAAKRSLLKASDAEEREA